MAQLLQQILSVTLLYLHICVYCHKDQIKELAPYFYGAVVVLDGLAVLIHVACGETSVSAAGQDTPGSLLVPVDSFNADFTTFLICLELPSAGLSLICHLNMMEGFMCPYDHRSYFVCGVRHW